MNFCLDLFSVIIGGVFFYVIHEPLRFLLTLVAAFVIAIFGFVACSRFSRLWNKQFHLKISHYLWCTVAAIFTLVFVVVFPSLSYVSIAAKQSISLWHFQITHDSDWTTKTYADVYEAVRRQKGGDAEDFTGYPPPDQGGKLVPLKNSASKLTFARVCVDDAAENFRLSRPFLSRLLSTHMTLPQSVLVDNLHDYFDGKLTLQAGETLDRYSIERAVSLAAERIKFDLDEQMPHFTAHVRWIIVGLFILAQALPFGIIGWAAHKEIKILTN